MPTPTDITDESILKQPNFHAALMLCARESGLVDKQIYGPLGLNAAQWSRIVHKHMHFPPDLVPQFMDICGNQIPLRWLAMTHGYDLKRKQLQIEQENQDLRQEVADLKRDKQTILEFAKNLR